MTDLADQIELASARRMRESTMFLLLALITGVAVINCSVAADRNEDDYWNRRTKIIEEEASRFLGGDLVLKGNEIDASNVLTLAKKREIDNAYQDPSKFWPAQNFLLVAKEIKKSEVYKMIQAMPKGAVLHAHAMALVSAEYIFGNITYRNNLYVCDCNGTLRLQFFERQPSSADCSWVLLAALRSENPEVINKRILDQLTMVTRKPDEAYPDKDSAWRKFSSILSSLGRMLTYRPVHEDHFYQGLLELYHDNVQYLELRTSLPTLYELNGTKYGYLEVARMYKETTERFVRDHPDFLGIRLIYAPRRNSNGDRLEQFVAIARELKSKMPEFVVGFDLVGAEDKSEYLVNFADQLRALSSEMRLFLHAGETNWYDNRTDANLVDAMLLGAKRIGHGYALIKHPKLMELIREKSIAIEICPISNQVLALVKDLRNHPASILFSENYPVVISNDDPGLWGGQGLSYDFYEAFVGMMSRSADLRALKKLALNSINFSSLNNQKKKRAFRVWTKKWTEFVDKLSNNSLTEKSV